MATSGALLEKKAKGGFSQVQCQVQSSVTIFTGNQWYIFTHEAIHPVALVHAYKQGSQAHEGLLEMIATGPKTISDLRSDS